MAITTPSGHLPVARSGGSTLFRVGLGSVATIWAAVVLISLFSPDNVSGAQQEHVPIAAILTWIWGLLATRTIITTFADERDHPDRFGELKVLGGVIAALWAGATAVAIWGPEIVTGTDPTRTPIAAILAPIVAMLMTRTGCELFSSLHKDKTSPSV